MYHQPIPRSGSTKLAGDRFPELRQFFENHRDGLSNAAELLAGNSGHRLVADLVDQLGCERDLSRRTWQCLRDLLGLLTLEHVHEPDRPEAAFFAAIDPSWPVVEEVCLLSDMLRGVLEAALKKAPEAPPLPAVA